MNISLPDDLRSFVDRQIQAGGYGGTSEYMCELIRRDRDLTQFWQCLLEGIGASPLGRMDAAYFAMMRRRLKESAKKK